MELSISSKDLFPTDKYPTIATNLSDCQKFLNQMEAWINDEIYLEAEQQRREKRYAPPSNNTEQAIKKLEEEISSAERKLESEPDANEIAWLNHQIKSAQVEIEGLNLLAENNRHNPMMAIKSNATVIKGKLFAQLLIHGTKDYIEKYVLKGELGEGQITFLGKTYEVIGAETQAG
ncbi:hypothetical protein [Aureibacter tunicatorum]|uniref:Uncharacterized protein n=1 Tax=Aureibacter tunicatorum TaxID=866807 RepID=A0AAE3XJL6_9BACT|nr:hypothetical protein [Aureibacter tunicatorum]MDR6237592.1 hypothetical protein [Aureibacter tunicatorum]BDD02626.1 hypothetical protein AUTU_01090 [Aureibacter tunicatorum]